MSSSTVTSTPGFPGGTILGYPRVGPRRELKKAIESFWAGKTTADDVEQAAAALRTRTRTRLVELGLDPTDASIPSNFSFYDQVLDAAVVVGAVPARFAHLVDPTTGRLDLAGYSTIARGAGDDLPAEMTKWFDTNYHYLVPEIGPDTVFRFADDRPVREFVEALAQGVLTRPVLVGPVTFLLLAKAADGAPEGFSPIDRLADLLPVYAELLTALAAAGATWVQLDEPALVSDSIDATSEQAITALVQAYTALAGDLAKPTRPALLVAAPYGDLGAALPALAGTAVDGIALDLVRGCLPAGPVAGLETKVLVAGVVDGHNIWRADLGAALDRLDAARTLGAASVSVGTSTSLLHVPHDVEDEPALDPTLRAWLAFADQKVGEVATLAHGLADGRDAVADQLAASSAALANRRTAPGVVRPEVRERLAGLSDEAFHRGDYAARKAAQAAKLQLPPLPTTTIGSFPQTPEIRKSRAAHAKGELSTEQYEAEMRAEIQRVVTLQEEIGLDVLVHGEPERNDMVQYFAENLDGFAATQNGWVQSYGSRCVRPPILWGDVARPAPITVAWSAYTASLTAKPVKGMLTGPVTILAWSFVRNDQPLGDTANQVALALRDEIADLEAAGIGIVQVDEPALRELLPLRAADQPAYLDWSVSSFRLATSGVRKDTQIHTHLCYSEFGEIIDAIDGLDADVTSIEAARSKMEILEPIAEAGYPRGIGPGVWDIHSPRVPSEAEVTELLGAAVRSIAAHELWVNPDCGLKTRRYQEVTPSLEHMVAATKTVRATLPA
ncbi:5-methyltetrahydropteroyltriglutamate--homocysteine S-methyltransferase [Pengzhenrongella frigida]|uniref:5-methyltetrahydropteroyltriglutamate--homocysteine methyltransferase n=1 Tax=Pengzhenrongella frigida TaxID=1259133 RepID=A0A4V1ZHF5_9MICO|nr:5-methyltetrahydropteroyltriglutamate--homocysteine S-methyltransferase [Cellulomonas sp. HLT2-17]RYV51864.1 5-methyltetrahydropteroyltriglutamate--homocysteine S-methyltransferase [Cellulomonas sp. HLT2-17]